MNERNGSSGGGFDGRAHQNPAIARIAVLGPRLEQQRTVLEVLQRFDRPLALHREQRSFVAAVVPDAGHMPHQLAQRHGPLFLRERRHVGLDLLVELQPAFLQQQSDRGRRERRGGGADSEPRIRRDGHMVLEIRPAKAFGPHEVAAGTDRHRKSRQVPLGEARTDDLPRPLHGVGPLWQRRRTRHGWHVLRVRVQGRRGGAHVHKEPQNRCGYQADGHEDQREPGLDPILLLRQDPSI